jgi:hypothetical protein
MSPHTFTGAPTSTSIGCSRKMLLTVRTSPRISLSRSLTSFPGLAVRTSSRVEIMSSTFTYTSPFIFNSQ